MDLTAFGLATRVFGRSIHHFDEVASTNDVAANFAQAGAEEGAVALATRQTQGRGRQSRRWESPSGGLWMSIVLRPKICSEELPGLTLVIATAVAQALQHLASVPARVRWPNDVYVADKKIAGLLAEARWSGDHPEFCCVGLGLNVNVDRSDFSQDVAESATSLQAVLGREVAVEPLLVALFERMEECYAAFCGGGFSALRAEVSQWCETLGREVKVREPDLNGRAMEIGPNGSLRVQTGEGLVDVWSCESIRLG